MDDVSLSRDQFLAEYLTALADGKAALFVGAGASKAAGYVDWKELLRGFADELGLDLEIEQDLVAVAQYHLNANNSDRSRLNALLVAEFTKDSVPTASHLAMAKLPVHTIWTSNYDQLLEQAYRVGPKKIDIKVSEGSLATSVPGADATVYKMHGDVNDPSGIIICRDDYERYSTTHGSFQTILRSQLCSMTFLFLGFSFSDPNLDYIFAQVRASFWHDPHPHFAVFRRDKDSEYAERRQQHRVADLKRYGVHVVLVDEYEEIPQLLEELYARYLRRSVLVSGAWQDPSPLGAERLDGLCRQIGKALIDNGYNLVSGFGLGVGGPTILGAIETLYRQNDANVGSRLQLFPFPQEAPAGMTREAFYTRYRGNMLSTAGFVVVVAGNRDRGTGIEPSPGVREEVTIGKQQAKYLVPIGATGWIARDVWNECVRDFDTLYPSGTPRDALDALGDEGLSEAELIGAMMRLIFFLTPRPH